jgi:hypothetical protein
MRAAAIQGLTTEDIVNFRNNSVDPKLVAAIRALGFGPYTPKQIIDISANGVRADLFQALKDNGIHQIDAREVIEARNNGINGSHLREARQFGPNLTIRQIIKLKNAGVI